MGFQIFINRACLLLFLSTCSVYVTSCRKLIEVSPPTNMTTGENVYKSDATAAAVLTDLYTKFSSLGSFCTHNKSISYLAGLSSDEFRLTSFGSTREFAYYQNELSINAGGFEFWDELYPYIFICNSAIDGLNISSSLTEGVRKQLLGEAKFIRALCYFYLVNCYGDVPLVLSTDYKINAQLKRTPRADVYKAITDDLLEAKTLLADNYVKADGITPYNSTSIERVRPNKWVAIALLSRTYLYRSMYDEAESEASAIISNSSMYSLTDLQNAFNKNNSESIWQLQPISTFPSNTGDGYLFIIPPATEFSSENPVYLNPELVNSFDQNDLRRKQWVDSIIINGEVFYYPFKYRVIDNSGPVTEYLTVFRLAEQYLIRAESRILNNKIAQGIDDLNILRKRASDETGPVENRLQSLDSDVTKDQAISYLMDERRHELFTEWGHRWFDLNRINSSAGLFIDIVMPGAATDKSGKWDASDKLFPISDYDILNNPNLKQNPGY